MLVLGQFGLVGLCLSMATLLWPAMRVAMQAPRSSGWVAQSLPLMLSTLVVLTVLDALMNSFIFFPALVVAGALAVSPLATERASRAGRTQLPRGEITRIPKRSAT